MTKTFCDYCKKEVDNHNHMTVSNRGSIGEKLNYKNYNYCEECYIKYYKLFTKFMSKKEKVK